jgi:hypothetical protein
LALICFKEAPPSHDLFVAAHHLSRLITTPQFAFTNITYRGFANPSLRRSLHQIVQRRSTIVTS